ncbi:uncharacterized protein LOC106645216 [Copidosoma floridanum]|uniref:uncharacterized protein LOC106645216 n=1 Tax=Copidosoma floridanum TaxID=29053 RepID=UPI0006C9869C|nr:uncharacterized protein LOC106645216 [Copidosoma floridanum]
MKFRGFKPFLRVASSFGRKNFSTKRAAPAGPRILVPGNCRELPEPKATINCRVALIIGGSNNGFGYSAAEQLLSRGARKVILADADEAAGAFAAERLCKAYGKDRARFYSCDPRNSCHVEGIFKSSICRDENVTILFNDLDAINRQTDPPLNYCPDEKKQSNVHRLTRLGLEHLLAKEGSIKRSTGLIINCASILGFLRWPRSPKPVYCHSEPSIETTVELAKEFPAERTGLRLVALCPAGRTYDSIGLPDDTTEESTHCPPDPKKDRGRMGRVLAHVMAHAESGSTWLIEAPWTLHEVPRLVQLLPAGGPDQRDELRKQEATCPVNFDTSGVDSPPGSSPPVSCPGVPLKGATCT